MDAQVIAFPALPHEVARRAQALAEDSSNVRWTEHVLCRMDQRDITDRQALNAMRKGRAEARKDEGGSWEVVFTRRTAGRRVTVVAKVNGELIVVTVY